MPFIPMIHKVVMIAIALHGLSSAAFAAEDTDRARFKSELMAAIAEKDEKKLEALTYFEGASPEDKQGMKSMLGTMYFHGKDVQEIHFEPLPGDFEPVLIVQGRKIVPTAEPKGMVRVTFDGTNHGPGNSSGAYTVVDGKIYFVGMKSTDLGWKGPPDQNIGYGVAGHGASEAVIQGVWNASGVRLEKSFKEPGLTFWGQYFEELSVRSERDDCDVTVTIHEDGKTIFSEPLKGKGVVRYQRKN